jgi:transcriptional regulator NrdR family protein
MRCPKCNFGRTRIIRTRPDPEFPCTDLVRQCKSPGCLAVFTSREAVVSVIEDSQDAKILTALAARIDALPAESRKTLLEMVRAG